MSSSSTAAGSAIDFTFIAARPETRPRSDRTWQRHFAPGSPSALSRCATLEGIVRETSPWAGNLSPAPVHSCELFPTSLVFRTPALQPARFLRP